MNERPMGVTLLTVGFEIVAVACFLLGVRGLSDAPPALPVSTALLLLLGFAVSAVVAFGLHGRRWWTQRAARIWAATALVLLLWLFLGPPHDLPLSRTAAIPLVIAWLGACWLIERYLPRVLAPPA